AGTVSSSATLSVLVAPRLQIEPLEPDGSVRMNLYGQTGRTYEVEISTNLTDWSVLRVVPYGGHPTPVTDAPSPLRHRFYRARLAQ
ncbi:MAG TPA: hypothetical protein VNO52_11655, partial [Methylomirabilota bacterium]|nr:hypothetical protein [Methylomirabilota bacterium]